MADKSPVIKKVKKITHHGGHGSSWKVAYADFVTALMAFFLMLWLISSLKPEQKENISTYFQNFNLLDKSALLDSLAKGFPVPDTTLHDQEQFIEQLKNDILEKLDQVKDQIMIETFPGGVKIQVVDVEGNPIFSLGGIEPTESAKNILKVVGANIQHRNAKIAIEGHTDALSFSGQKFTNWELSTARASAARQILEKEGLPPSQLRRVSGFADTAPLFREDPFDPRNRRISILVFFHDPDIIKQNIESDIGGKNQTEEQGTHSAESQSEPTPAEEHSSGH